MSAEPDTRDAGEHWRARCIFHADTGAMLLGDGSTVEVSEPDGSFSVLMRSPTHLERRLAPREDGAIVVVERMAKTMDGTLDMAWQEAREFAAFAALASGGCLGPITPMLIYDATVGHERRPFRQFLAHAGLRVPARVQPESIAEVVRAAVNHPARVAIEDAVGRIAESASQVDGLVAFATAWLAVERLNPALQEKYGLSGFELQRKKCGEGACPGAEVKVPMGMGSRHLAVEVMKRKEDWKALKALRVQLQHGLKPCDDLAAEARKIGAAALAREFALAAIRVLLDLGADQLAASPHGLGERIMIGGTYINTALPPTEGDEPYLTPSRLEAKFDADGRATVEAAFTGAFDCSFEVAEVGITGAKGISKLLVS